MSYQDNDCDKCTKTRMCPEHEVEMLDSEILRCMNKLAELKKDNSEVLIERARKKAVKTGSRNDLQEYLKLRRRLL